MARVPQVTRTIQTTKAIIMCLNIETGESTNVEAVLPRTYKDDTALIKAAKKELETDTLKVVHVISSTTHETLYGMSEADFIKNAEILPPRFGNTDEESEEAETANETVTE